MADDFHGHDTGTLSHLAHSTTAALAGPGATAPMPVSAVNEAEQLRAKIAAMQAAIDRQRQQQPAASTAAAPVAAPAAAIRPVSRSGGAPAPPPGRPNPTAGGNDSTLSP